MYMHQVKHVHCFSRKTGETDWDVPDIYYMARISSFFFDPNKNFMNLHRGVFFHPVLITNLTLYEHRVPGVKITFSLLLAEGLWSYET